MKTGRNLIKAALFAIFFMGFSATALADGRLTIFNSPYVSFSADGKAWTTNAGEQNVTWYGWETSVNTGIKSSLPKLQTGEHYYDYDRQGSVPVARWEIAHRFARCVHSIYPTGNYHGLSFGKSVCDSPYYSGWMAYCADCGRRVTYMLPGNERGAGLLLSLSFLPEPGTGRTDGSAPL